MSTPATVTQTVNGNAPARIPPRNLRELEASVSAALSDIGLEIIRRRLLQLVDDAPALSTRCRCCGRKADYRGSRARFVRTIAGPTRIWRAYYICSHCDEPTIPFDERLDPIQSLARMGKLRRQGVDLPVGEMAAAWDLGRLSRVGTTR